MDDSPFAAADANGKHVLGFDAGSPLPRLEFWASRHPGTRIGDDRYRWELSHRRARHAPHVPPVEQWTPFRADVEPELARMEQRLSVPLSVAEHCEYLARLAEDADPKVATRASTLLDEATPLFRRDLAQHIQASHPWTDTFALYALVRCPRALERLRPLAIAIASVYGALLEDHAVRGLRYPFAEVPLASATAQLAWGLLRLGLEVPRLSGLVRFVREARRPSGAWGDGSHSDDLLVTLPCLELLARVDPAFDTAPTLSWLASAQREDGFFTIMGPEAPWLTAALVTLIEDCTRPFAARFRWPQVPATHLDRKTGLPFFSYFDDLAQLMSGLDGLREADIQLAFLDLARFREFNNQFGQDMGDAVLEAFATTLRETSNATVVRDGGDEMLVLGAPTRSGLAQDLDQMRKEWPSRFRTRFGDSAPPVAPRIVVTKAHGGDLRAMREQLGKSVGALKLRSKDVGPEGALAEV